jgi:hypothetical protein
MRISGGRYQRVITSEVSFLGGVLRVRTRAKSANWIIAPSFDEGENKRQGRGGRQTKRIRRIWAGGDKDMFRFQISMENPPRVAVLHGTDELSHGVSDLRQRVREERCEPFSDLILLHGIVPDAVQGVQDVVEGHLHVGEDEMKFEIVQVDKLQRTNVGVS